MTFKPGFILSGVFLIGLLSCSQPISRKKENSAPAASVREVKFRKFLSKFKPISYPFEASTACYEPDSLSSVPLDADNDSLFTDYTGPGVTIGLLPDTANFYAVLYCAAATCYMPILATFTKNGNLISREILINGCGAGMGYTCRETLKLNSMKDIKRVHFEEITSFDSTGKEIPMSRKRNQETKKCYIDKEGVIHSSVTLRKW